MSNRAVKEAIVIVLNVGPSVSMRDNFLERARQCITNIVQRKILAQSKDELGLILVGSEDTNNPLFEDGQSYENIEIVHTLELANWSMVHTLSKYQKCTTTEGDWLDALIVAADLIKTEAETKRFKEKKIVLVSNFCSSVSDDQIEVVIQGLTQEEVQVIAIGLDDECVGTSEENSGGGIKIEDQTESGKLIRYLCHEVPNSIACSFEEAIPQLSLFELKKTRPMPWKVIMDIGSTIQLPMVGYKKVAPVVKLKTHDIMINSKPVPSNVRSQDPTNNAVMETQDASNQDCKLEKQESVEDGGFQLGKQESNEDFDFVDKDRAYQTIGDDATRVDIAEVIDAYMFGTTVVTVTDDDKPRLEYESGPKCLSVLGFTKRQNVPLHLFKGDGCHKFFPEKEENCIKAFSALVQAMDSKDVIAIARRVYRANTCPFICALFPMITEDFQCFVLIDLPYAEDISHFFFPPLVTENNKPTQEQLSAVDQLISSMNLMMKEEGSDEVEEAYDPRKTLDPYMQHYNSIVAKKALDGDVHIRASDVSETVKELLSPKEELVMAAKPALEKIKRLYLLTEVTPKEGARKAAVDVFKLDVKPDVSTTATTLQVPSDTKAGTPHIGTVQPQNDFNNLLVQGVPLDKACSLLHQVITDMVSMAFDEDDFGKPYECLVHMRKECAHKNPLIYNECLKKLRNDLPPEKMGFWILIVDGDSGLITSSENGLSLVSAEEAKMFLQTDEVMDVSESAQPVEEDIDDLINQM